MFDTKHLLLAPRLTLKWLSILCTVICCWTTWLRPHNSTLAEREQQLLQHLKRLVQSQRILKSRCSVSLQSRLSDILFCPRTTWDSTEELVQMFVIHYCKVLHVDSRAEHDQRLFAGRLLRSQHSSGCMMSWWSRRFWTPKGCWGCMKIVMKIWSVRRYPRMLLFYLENNMWKTNSLDVWVCDDVIVNLIEDVQLTTGRWCSRDWCWQTPNGTWPGISFWLFFRRQAAVDGG